MAFHIPCGKMCHPLSETGLELMMTSKTLYRISGLHYVTEIVLKKSAKPNRNNKSGFRIRFIHPYLR